MFIKIDMFNVWLIIASVFILGELIIPGVFLVWLGISASIVALIIKVFSDFNINAQIILFTILSFIFCSFYYFFVYKKQKDNKEIRDLNNFQHDMINKVGKVIEFDQEAKIGRALIGDTYWKISSKDNLTENDAIKVINSEGILLKVSKNN